jgi:hypothetical protein
MKTRNRDEIPERDDIEQPGYRQLEKENKLVLSYLTVRKIIGVLGLLLPLILVLGSVLIGGCREIQQSISNYYHTSMRDVFVGYLCALSIFLLSYKGYDLTDRMVSALAGIFGLTVALLPTTIKIPALPCNIICNVSHPGYIGTIHLIAAGLFLITLGCFSLFLFTKGETNPTPQKLLRNKVYRGAAYIIFVCVGILIVFFALPKSISGPLIIYKPVFWLETFAVMAFGTSWLVKGEVILRDE